MKLTKEQAQEIKDLQSQENKTKRVVAPELEKILYDVISVLDHGFVRVIDYMEMILLSFKQQEYHTVKEQKKFQQIVV